MKTPFYQTKTIVNHCIVTLPAKDWEDGEGERGERKGRPDSEFEP